MKILRASVAFFSALIFPAAAAPGDTQIARWKDGKKAAFLMYFDDGWPSHWQVAIPEMVKRGLIGTFYLNPEKGEYKKYEQKWIEEIPATGMVYANHTMTHQGVRDMEHAEYEIGACAEYLRKLTKKPKPELLSYGQPGVGKGRWNITAEQLDELLKKHKMIARAKMEGHMAVYHLKTPEDMLKLADKAIGSGGVEYVTFHGIERKEPDWGYQDFWALPQDVFFSVLDGLKERQDKGDLWVTDHISQHKYEVQRDTTNVTVVKNEASQIVLELGCTADPVVYDGSLTLIVEVPAEWKTVSVSQGSAGIAVDAKDGRVMFDVLPGTVKLTPK